MILHNAEVANNPVPEHSRSLLELALGELGAQRARIRMKAQRHQELLELERAVRWDERSGLGMDATQLFEAIGKAMSEMELRQAQRASRK